jgi:ribosomal protein S18 acetylase RimI-like enzyme
MAALEDTARNLGATTVQLDTNKALTEAQALYRGIGYQEVDAFNENPYAHHWFRKQL